MVVERIRRLALVADGPNTLPATVTKTTYAGGHSEIALETEIGPLFLVSSDPAPPPVPGARVKIGFAPSDAVLLLS